MTPWTVARQALLSMGILQARILERVAIPLLQGIFPTQGSNLGLPQADSLPSEPPGKPYCSQIDSLCPHTLLGSPLFYLVEGKDRDFEHAKVMGSWVNYLNSGRLCCIIRIRKQQSILGMGYLILFNPQNVSFDMKFQIPTEHSENTGFLPPSVILCKAFTSCLSKSRVLLCSHHGLPALLN